MVYPNVHSAFVIGKSWSSTSRNVGVGETAGHCSVYVTERTIVEITANYYWICLSRYPFTYFDTASASGARFAEASPSFLSR